jgi:hypothetical protein
MYSWKIITSHIYSILGNYIAMILLHLKNGVFWDVTPCGFCKNQRFGVTWYLVFLRSVRRLLVTANVVPSTPILVTLMKEALSSVETLVLTEPHGVTSQKTQFFIVTVVKTSNLTLLHLLIIILIHLSLKQSYIFINIQLSLLPFLVGV